MSKVFTRAFRVRWSETNAEGQVDITSYMRYLLRRPGTGAQPEAYRWSNRTRSA